MNAEIPWPLFGVAFAAGIAGSAHCFAMCGGLSGALAMRARQAGGNASHAALHNSLHQLGRVAGYTLAGALVGILGQGTQWFLHLVSAAALLRVAAGVLTLLIAVRLLWNKNFLGPLERGGARVWRQLQPLIRLSSPGSGWHKSLALGMLWGWLPCGMVYSILLVSMTTGSAAAGAATMFSFGIGTLPAMLGSSWLLSRMPHSGGRPHLRTASGVMLAAFGVWLLLQPLLSGGHVHWH